MEFFRGKGKIVAFFRDEGEKQRNSSGAKPTFF